MMSRSTTQAKLAEPSQALVPGGVMLVKAQQGDVQVSQIGSSLVVVAHDPIVHLGCLAHIVLPDSNLPPPVNTALPTAAADATEEQKIEKVAKFADQAIPALLETFENAGAVLKRSRFRLVGGGQLFNFGGGSGNPLNVGFRNAIAARAALSKAGLRVEKADVGGNKARGLRYVLSTGQIFVSLVGGREYLI